MDHCNPKSKIINPKSDRGLPGFHRAGPSTPLDEQYSVVATQYSIGRGGSQFTYGRGATYRPIVATATAEPLDGARSDISTLILPPPGGSAKVSEALKLVAWPAPRVTSNCPEPMMPPDALRTR